MKHIKQLLVFLLIINVFNSCEKEEISYALEGISAPTNVNAHFDISQDEVGLVTVTPTAEGATSFEVYFGDTENEAPTVLAPGETASHTYGEGEFNLRIVAIGLTGLTSEYVRVVVISLDPPTDLEVDVAISGSNPFEVTVTPSANNAAVFDIYFGDEEDEEPTTIMAGESATHEYAEVGEYTIRVVARGAGVATLEATRVVNITGASNAMALPITFDDATVNYAFETFNGASFEVVTNPDVSGANNVASNVGAITNSGNNWEGGVFELGTPADFTGENKTVTMKFWSQNEVPVLLKFEAGIDGERDTEVVATHGGTGWEELSFNFATDAIRSFIDGNNDNGQAFVPTGRYGSIVIFVDGPGNTAGTFYIDDIVLGDGDGGNGGETTVATTFPIDFESNQTLSGVFEDSQGVTGFPVENPDKSGINTSNTVFQFTKASGAAWYSGIFHIFPQNIDFSSNKTLSIKIWSPKSGINVRMQLEKEGGGGGPNISVDQPVTAANEWITLTFDFEGIVNEADAYDKFVIFPDFDDAAQPAGDGSVYYIDDIMLTSGSDGGNGDGGNGTTGPTAAAPEPTALAANVKSIFSDSYTDPAGVNYFPNWGQSTEFEMVSINGNEAIKYSNINYQGIEFGENVDATAFETVHIDVWSADYTSLPFFLISSTGERSVTLNLNANQWNSIEIPLSEFTDQGLTINDVFQFKFDVQPDNGGTIYLDNIYFSTSGTNGGGDNGGDNGGNNGGDNGGGTTGEAPYSPIDFEQGGIGANWSWTVFENGSNPPLEIVDNPSMTGINTSSQVAKFTALQAGEAYAGVESQRNEDIGDFTFDSTNSIVKIMVYKSVISDVGLKFSEASGEAQQEIKVANTKINEWEELTFDLSGSIGAGITGVITQIIIFPDFQSRTSDNVVYFDNITFGSN